MTQSKSVDCLDIFKAIGGMNTIFKEKGAYYTYQQYFVPYKIYLLAWAWKLAPEEQRECYYKTVKLMFEMSDMRYFINDSVWSYYELPTYENVLFIKTMIEKEWEEFCIVKLDSEDKSVPKEAWELISKPHLYAIKICEKLHILNLAIKIKKIFTK